MHEKVHDSRIWVQVKSKKRKKLAILSISWVGFTGLSSMNPWTNDAGYKLIMYYAKDLTLVNSNIRPNLYMNWINWNESCDSVRGRQDIIDTIALPCAPYQKFRMKSHLVPFRYLYTPIWSFLTFKIHSYIVPVIFTSLVCCPF